MHARRTAFSLTRHRSSYLLCPKCLALQHGILQAKFRERGGGGHKVSTRLRWSYIINGMQKHLDLKKLEAGLKKQEAHENPSAVGFGLSTPAISIWRPHLLFGVTPRFSSCPRPVLRGLLGLPHPWRSRVVLPSGMRLRLHSRCPPTSSTVFQTRYRGPWPIQRLGMGLHNHNIVFDSIRLENRFRLKPLSQTGGGGRHGGGNRD